VEYQRARNQVWYASNHVVPLLKDCWAAAKAIHEELIIDSSGAEERLCKLTAVSQEF
jgi:hypothetical protein